MKTRFMYNLNNMILHQYYTKQNIIDHIVWGMHHWNVSSKLTSCKY